MLPETTEEVVAIVKLANRLRIPIVPRPATGLNDGVKPSQGGIVVDTKRMNKVLEIDTTDWTVTIQPSINMLKLNEAPRPPRRLVPRRPGLLPGQHRLGPHRHRRLVAAGQPLRPRPRQRHLHGGRPAHRRGRRGRPGRRPQDPPLVHQLPAQGPVPRPPGHPRHRHPGHPGAVPGRGQFQAFFGTVVRRRLRPPAFRASPWPPWPG